MPPTQSTYQTTTHNATTAISATRPTRHRSHPVPVAPAALALMAGLSLVLSVGCATQRQASIGTAPAKFPAGTTASATPAATNANAAAAMPTGDQFAANISNTPASTTGPNFRWTLDTLADAEAGATKVEPRERRPVASSSATSSESLAYADVADSLTQVTFTTAGNDFDPVVSRDGRVIVFASTQHRPSPDLYLARVGSRAITQLTTDPASDAMPAISPDGRTIAFASDRSGVWQVYIMPIGGGRAVALTDDAAPAMHPTFSPDSSRVAFSRLGQMSGRWELWVAPTSNPAQAEFIGFGLKPTWCPVAGTGEDGSDRIAFQRARERGDRAYSLWSIDYRPGNVGSPVQIVPAEQAAAINPAWSPDGQFIAYASVPVASSQNQAGAPKSSDKNTDKASGLWITTADGAARVNVSAGRDVALAPTWAATDRLFFVTNRAGRDQVWSVGTQRAIAALPKAGQSNLTAGPNAAPTASARSASRATPANPAAQPEPSTPVASGLSPSTMQAPAPINTPAQPTEPDPTTASAPSPEAMVPANSAEPIASIPEPE